MKFASDYRRIAREALKGKWFLAVLVGLVAVILGGASNSTPSLRINFSGGSDTTTSSDAANSLTSLDGTALAILTGVLGVIAIILVIAIIIGIVYFILGSFVAVGYAKFNLNLIDNKEASFGNLFEYFRYWKRTAAASFLVGLYVFLWSLLFIIPGIIAAYSYSMTNYILAENPDMTAREAIRKSKEMMHCNKESLFLLELSFIGWQLLSLLTCMIGNLFLNPYIHASRAAFYRNLNFKGILVENAEQPVEETEIQPQDQAEVQSEEHTDKQADNETAE